MPRTRLQCAGRRATTENIYRPPTNTTENTQATGELRLRGAGGHVVPPTGNVSKESPLEYGGGVAYNAVGQRHGGEETAGQWQRGPSERNGEEDESEEREAERAVETAAEGELRDANREASEGESEEEADPAGRGDRRASARGRRAKKKKAEQRKAQKTMVRVGTLNMNGFGNLTQGHNENKWGKMYRTMQDQRIGILLLQETHLTEERRRDIHRIFAQRIKVLHSEHPTAPTQKEGVAVVLNKKIVNAEGAQIKVVVPGRAIQLEMPWRGGKTKRMLCVYAPTSAGSGERKDFFNQVTKFYEEHRDVKKPHLMAGDFNNIEDPIDRAPLAAGAADPSIDALDELKRTLGLSMVDGWRKTYPTSREYTFQRGSGRDATMSRLDRIYVDRETERWAREWKIEPVGVRTDHNLVSVLITTENAPEVGRGRPIFPLNLLGNKALAKQMKERAGEAVVELEEIRRNGRTEARNAQITLKCLKKDWLEMAREMERKTVPKLLQEIGEAEEELRTLGRSETRGETERQEQQRLLTEQLRKLKETRIKQRQERTKAKHRCDGELPTKYWTRLHKDPKPRELIPAFEVEGRATREGEKIYETNLEKMAELARAHYDGIQKDGPEIKSEQERERDIRAALGNIRARVSEEERAEMAAGIEGEDVQMALRAAKAGTAPGLDGIQYEVWKAMDARYRVEAANPVKAGGAVDVTRILTEAFVDIQTFGVSKKTEFAEGWISPIYKEKGETTKVVNYRPITLLNTDYKLLTKIMAIKL
ncbi:Endonuclease/exonuclease/phosphatase, partial [Lenzites betulinus]